MKRNILLILCLCPLLAFADGLFDEEDGKKWPQLTPLSWSDERYLKDQVERIDIIGRQKLGTPVRGNMGDIKLLQRIADQRLIEKSDKQTLQAMGSVIGNLMVQTNGFGWKGYEDQYGRTRAVCVLDTDKCLFPVTMLSRRIEAGLDVDVQLIYDNAVSLIKPYLPKGPYEL